MAEYAFDSAPQSGGYQVTANAVKSGGGGQVTREMERQWAAVEELHGRLGLLEDRLSIIRLGKPESAPSTRDQPEPVRADLAQGIAGVTARMEDATRRISTLLDEIEL